MSALLLEGRTRLEISRTLYEKYKVALRTVDDYIAVAKEEIQEVNKNHLEHDVALLVRNLWKIYREAQKHSDKISALKEIARIRGIGTSNINLTMEDKRELAHLSDEELDAFYASASH